MRRIEQQDDTLVARSDGRGPGSSAPPRSACCCCCSRRSGAVDYSAYDCFRRRCASPALLGGLLLGARRQSSAIASRDRRTSSSSSSRRRASSSWPSSMVLSSARGAARSRRCSSSPPSPRTHLAHRRRGAVPHARHHARARPRRLALSPRQERLGLFLFAGWRPSSGAAPRRRTPPLVCRRHRNERLARRADRNMLDEQAREMNRFSDTLVNVLGTITTSTTR